MRFHDLRHTAATLLLSEGHDVTVAQRRLGHADPATTRRMYGHALPDQQRAAAEKVAAALQRARQTISPHECLYLRRKW